MADRSTPGVHPDVIGATPRSGIMFSVVLSWLQAALVALLIVQLGTIIDELAQGTPVPRWRNWAMLGFIVAAAGCRGIGIWSSEAFTARTEGRLRRLVVSRIFASDPLAHAGKSGSLLSLTTDSVERASGYRAGFLGPITAAMTAPLVVLAVMAITTDSVTAGWITLCVLCVPLLIGGFQRLVKPVGGRYRRSQAKLTAGFLEAIQALDTLVYARAADRIARDLAAKGEAHRRQITLMLAVNQLLILVVDAGFSLAVIATAALTARQRLNAGFITLGQGVAIVAMTVLVIGPVDVVGQFFYIGIRGRGAERAISRIAAAPPASSPAVTASGNAAVELCHVSAAWPGGNEIIHNLSLRIDPGEHVGIVGPSGVGKSTLAALIQGKLLPSSGKVRLAGKPASYLTSRDDLAVIAQRPYLFTGTVAENLRMAKPEASDEELWSALAIAGLREEVEAMAEGLCSDIGEHGALLSGGQAQRLAIARAALRDAPILLFDEPTSHVDLGAEAAIVAALERLSVDATVIMIAHRPGSLVGATRIIHLDEVMGS